VLSNLPLLKREQEQSRVALPISNCSGAAPDKQRRLLQVRLAAQSVGLVCCSLPDMAKISTETCNAPKKDSAWAAIPAGRANLL